MMGECRAKGRGTRCPAEVGKVQHRILQVKWRGWDSQTQSRCKWIHGISCEGPWGVLPASPDEGWGSGYGQAGRHRVGLAAQLWLSFTPSLQPLGQDFCCCVELPTRVSHGWGDPNDGRQLQAGSNGSELDLSPGLLLAIRWVMARHIPTLASPKLDARGMKEQASPYLLLCHNHSQHFCSRHILYPPLPTHIHSLWVPRGAVAQERRAEHGQSSVLKIQPLITQWVPYVPWKCNMREDSQPIHVLGQIKAIYYSTQLLNLVIF